MFFSKDDLAVIVTCFTEKGWTGTRIAKEFPNKKWNYRSINRVLAKYRHTDTTEKVSGMMSTIRQSEKLYCSGKGVCNFVQQQRQSKMEDIFRTFSADQLTDDYCDVLV